MAFRNLNTSQELASFLDVAFNFNVTKNRLNKIDYCLIMVNITWLASAIVLVIVRNVNIFCNIRIACQ